MGMEDFSGTPTAQGGKMISEMDSRELEEAVLIQLGNNVEKFIEQVVDKADEVLLLKALLIIKKKLTNNTYTNNVKSVDRRINELSFDVTVELHEYMKHDDVVIYWTDKFGDTILTARLCPHGLLIGESDEKELSGILNIVERVKQEKLFEKKQEELKKREEELKKREEELKEREEELKEREEEMNSWEKRYNGLKKKVAEVFGLYTNCSDDP